MIFIRHVETHAGGDEHVLLLQQIERKLLIIEIGYGFRIDADERIHGAMHAANLEVATAAHRVEQRTPGFIEATARTDQLANTLIATERSLHRPLRRNVAA